MDWKNTLNSLYDSVPKSEETEEIAVEKPTVKKQSLRVELDKRKGKPAGCHDDKGGAGKGLEG